MNAVVVTIIHLLVFLGVGLLGSVYLIKKKLLPVHFAVIGAYAISLLFDYALFFVYAKSPGIGTIVTGLFYLFGLLSAFLLVYWSAKNRSVKTIITTNVLLPLALILTVCGFYTVITFGCRIPNGLPLNIYQGCILENTPGDNILPQFFGDKLIQNRDRDLAVDWHLADRPPLQIGGVVSLLDIIPNDALKLASYQVFSTFLQLAWIAGLWAFLKFLKIESSQEKFILFTSVFLGFYYYNSVYVWPKLLAAGLALAGLSLLLFYKQADKKDVLPRWIAASCLLVLSLLSHGSTLFIIISLGLYLLITRRLPSVRVILIAACCALALYSPWILYKSRTTTSDRLVKWHFAGVIQPDERSTVKTIIDSYQAASISQIMHAKVENFKTLVYYTPYEITPHEVSDAPNANMDSANSHKALLSNVRRQEFYATLPALGVINLGWIVMVMLFKKNRKAFDVISQPLALGLLATLVWCMLMFIPGSTVIHQNSYTTMMLIITAPLIAISFLNNWGRWLIAGAQVILFCSVWGMQVYSRNSRSPWLSLSIGLIGVMSLLFVLYFREISTFVRVKASDRIRPL